VTWWAFSRERGRDPGELRANEATRDAVAYRTAALGAGQHR
jgi:hypothetical protein